MVRSKFLSPEEIQKIVDQTEQDVEQWSREQQIQEFIDNPANAAQLAEVRKQFAAIDARRAQPARPAAPAPQRTVAPLGSPANPWPAHRRFDENDMKGQSAQVSRVIDPTVR